jgi:type II secretory ATPase GspE/PulE/Tfp pilus assembly ATPase PilB-like protein
MTRTYDKRSPKEDTLDAPQVEELLKNLEFHKAIQDITGRINTASGLREILVNIKEDIRRLFHIHQLVLYVVDPGKKEIFTISTYGNKSREVRFPINNSTFAGYVAQKKKILHIPDAYNTREIRKISDSLKFDDSHDKRTSATTGQILVIPIMHESIVLGVMEIMNHKDADAIDEYNQIFLDEITACLAGAFLAGLDFVQSGSKNATRLSKLIRDGALTSHQMNNALRESLVKKEHVETILTQSYNVSHSEIGAALEEFFACPFIPYSEDIYIPPQMLSGIERTSLEELMWIPLKVVKGEIHILMSDPSDHLKKREIEKILETDAISFNVGTTPDILKLIDHFYPHENEPAAVFAPDKVPLPKPAQVGGRKQQANDIAHSTFIVPKAPESPLSFRSDELFSPVSDLPTHTPPEPDARPPAPEEPAEKPLPPASDDILLEACSRGASDIHFEPDPLNENIFSRIRVDGQFLSLRTLSYGEYETIAADIKHRANLDAAVSTAIQTGRFTLERASGEEIQMTATFIPTGVGIEDAVIHICSKARLIPLELLGLSESLYAELLNILYQPRGVVFIVGPAGAGITTTLHACLESINTPDKKIWTAEENIEIVQSGLRQVAVDPQNGFDFHHVLRAFLNADPDVIMVDSVHDLETAALCMEASLQGHLVLASFPAETVTGMMEKCLDMGLHHLVFADAMLATVEQRLMKTLCPKCRQKYHPGRDEYDEIADIYGPEAFQKLNIPYSESFSLYRPVGCDECGQTGYGGRTCVVEIFTFTPVIKRMLRRKENIDGIYHTALAGGMNTLIREALAKVLQGQTDYRHARLACLKQYS